MTDSPSQREEFGQRLSAVRKALGLSFQELGRRADVSYKTIKNIEEGSPVCERRSALKLVKALAVLDPPRARHVAEAMPDPESVLAALDLLEEPEVRPPTNLLGSVIVDQTGLIHLALPFGDLVKLFSFLARKQQARGGARLIVQVLIKDPGAAGL
jgi:transcriptional regulator with XRE-family HTH domain